MCPITVPILGFYICCVYFSTSKLGIFVKQSLLKLHNLLDHGLLVPSCQVSKHITYLCRIHRHPPWFLHEDIARGATPWCYAPHGILTIP